MELSSPRLIELPPPRSLFRKTERRAASTAECTSTSHARPGMTCSERIVDSSADLFESAAAYMSLVQGAGRRVTVNLEAEGWRRHGR